MFINYTTPKKKIYSAFTHICYYRLKNPYKLSLHSVSCLKDFPLLSACSLPEVKLLTPGTRFVHLKLSNGRTSPLPSLSSAAHLQMHTVPRWWEHLSRRWQEDRVLLGTDTTKQSQSWLYLDFSLSQFRKRKVPDFRQPCKQNKQACKWDVLWTEVCVYWQEKHWNLQLYVLIPPAPRPPPRLLSLSIQRSYF